MSKELKKIAKQKSNLINAIAKGHIDVTVRQYAHNGYEDKTDAHLKRQIIGKEVVVAITKGKLHFGAWEQIFYGDFDGRRKRRVLVKIIEE